MSGAVNIKETVENDEQGWRRVSFHVSLPDEQTVMAYTVVYSKALSTEVAEQRIRALRDFVYEQVTG